MLLVPAGVTMVRGTSISPGRVAAACGALAAGADAEQPPSPKASEPRSSTRKYGRMRESIEGNRHAPDCHAWDRCGSSRPGNVSEPGRVANTENWPSVRRRL